VCATARLHAQDTDANADQARALFEAGIAASRQARWSDAEDLFERSRRLVEKPSTLLNLAIAQVNLGHGRAALESLAQLDAIADPSAHAAVLERARSLREEARALALSAAQNELLLTLPLEGEALALLNAGAVSYAEGRYAEALASFERAEALSRRSELLYNIGLSADRLRAEGRALLAFEAFVAAFPDDARARALGPRLDTLRLIVRGERAEEPAPSVRPAQPEVIPAPAPVVSAPQAPRTSLRLPVALLSVGALAAAGGAVTTTWWFKRIDAQDRCDRKKELCTNGDDIARQRKSALSVSVILEAAAVGLLTAGATLFLKRKQESARTQAWLRISPNGVTLGVDHL